MEPEPRHARLNASPVESLADRIPAHRPTTAPDEHPARSGPLGHVRSQDRDDVRRDHHRSLARVRLGLSIERGPAALKQLDATPAEVSDLTAEAYAVRILDALRDHGAPAIRQHDGTHVLDAAPS
jgi:hypothetical protein